jgi:hypothetical protein
LRDIRITSAIYESIRTGAAVKLAWFVHENRHTI